MLKIVQLYNPQRCAFGGEGTVIANTTALLRQRGHQVIHATRSSKGIEESVVRKVAAAINGVYSFSASTEIKRIIETERPDIVHAHNIYPQWSPSVFRACRQLGVPTVLHVHCHYLTCPNWYHLRDGKVCELCFGGKEYWCVATNCRGSLMESAAYALRSCVARKMKLFDNVSLFVAVSQFLKDRLVAAGFPEERIEVLHNSVSDDALPTDDPLDDGEYIGYCGRLSPEKGVNVLIDAARHSGLPVRIAGDGPERGALERNAPSNVTFLGYLDRDAIGRFYRHCRFVVLPSISFEGFPMVAVEAMMRGKPVLASRIGAIPEIVEHDRTGLLFDAGNSEQLAGLMSALWTDPMRCLQYGRAARDAVKVQCSEEAYYARLLAIYRRAANVQGKRTLVSG